MLTDDLLHASLLRVLRHVSLHVRLRERPQLIAHTPRALAASQCRRKPGGRLNPSKLQGITVRQPLVPRCLLQQRANIIGTRQVRDLLIELLLGMPLLRQRPTLLVQPSPLGVTPATYSPLLRPFELIDHMLDNRVVSKAWSLLGPTIASNCMVDSKTAEEQIICHSEEAAGLAGAFAASDAVGNPVRKFNRLCDQGMLLSPRSQTRLGLVGQEGINSRKHGQQSSFEKLGATTSWQVDEPLCNLTLRIVIDMTVNDAKQLVGGTLCTRN